MTIVEEEDHWRISLGNGIVDALHIDSRLGISVCDGEFKAWLWIETYCELSYPEASLSLSLSKIPSLAPMPTILNRTVSQISIARSGCLSMYWDNNFTLDIVPDTRYEAWTLECPTIGKLFICNIGGDFSLFEENSDSQRAQTVFT